MHPPFVLSCAVVSFIALKARSSQVIVPRTFLARFTGEMKTERRHR